MNILGIVLTKDNVGFHVLDFKFEAQDSVFISRFEDIPNESISFYDKTNEENHYLAFSEFWAVQKFIVRYESDINIKKELPKGTEKNLTSISLAAFLAPLTLQNDYKFSFTHICTTGLVKFNEEQGIKEVIVDSVTKVKEKYEAFSKYVETIENKNGTFAFVYVSKNKLNPKIEKKNIKTFHIYPYTPVEELLDRLSSGFRRPVKKFYQFNNAVYSKLSAGLDENECQTNAKSFNAKIILSGNKNSKNFFDFKWFDIFRQAIDQGYKFSLQVDITRFLSNSEITSDDMKSELLPKWWHGDISNGDSIEVNERLKRLDLFVQNQIDVLKRYVYETYAYTESERKISGRLNISINYCNSGEIKLFDEKETENALIIDIDGRKYVSCSNADYFEYNFYEKDDSLPEEIQKLGKIMIPEKKAENVKFINKEDSEQIIRILDSPKSSSKRLKEVGNLLKKLKSKKTYLPQFILYGLPGSGKSTLAKKIVGLYREKLESEKRTVAVDDIHIISSDFLINERIFDDDLNSRHNPNKMAKHQDITAINEHVIYTRNDYESFLDGEHDMDIRNLAVEIAIRQSAVTHDVCDLGGKEVLIERTHYLINDLGFITVFVCPDGEPSKDSIIFVRSADKETEDKNNFLAYFEAYYNFYFEHHDLFNESKRRNIYKLGEPFKEFKNDKDEIIDIEPENWNDFKEKLRKHIFNPRFYFYNRKYDLKVFRRGTEDDMVCNILKGILQIHLERLEREEYC